MLSGEHCTCGCTKVHIVAEGLTYDGFAVRFWSDGHVSGRFGDIRGLGAPRSTAGRMAARRALWAVRQDVSILSRASLAAVVKAARAAAANPKNQTEEIRAAMWRAEKVEP